jgi:sugar O-acyltransferase (sialic acid O-acetyltransferase NeuD family)
MTAARTPLVIVGTGGHGREAHDIVEAMNAERPVWDFLGFLDDAVANHDLVRARGAEVLGPVALLADLPAHYVIGIGSGAVRRAVDRQATEWGREAAVLVHPTVSQGRCVDLAPGVVLAAGARVTTNVVLGRHAQVNVNATVSHDCVVGDYVTVSPGTTVCGTVALGEGVLLGAGSTVIQGLSIGPWATVGAGAVVVRSLPGGVTAVGVPARPFD